MNLLEMVRNGELHLLVLVIPFIVLIISILCCLLAKAKNKNMFIAIVIGLIPIMNGLALIYYIGAPKKEAPK